MFLTLLFGLTILAVAENNIENIKTQAEQGNAKAQSVLAASYSGGKNGLSQDHVKAYYWYKKAAEQGDAISQFLLGGAYSEGKGVRQDHHKAMYWLKKSASQNNAAAQFYIGTMYFFGEGVRQNKAQAKEWYGISCDNGDQTGCDFYRKLNEQGH